MSSVDCIAVLAAVLYSCFSIMIVENLAGNPLNSTVGHLVICRSAALSAG